MTWQIQSTSWMSVANSTPSIGSGHRYDHMTRTWTAPTGASSLRGKTTQAILRVHGKYPHGKGQQVPSTSKGRKTGRQCIFCWAGPDGGMAPSCQALESLLRLCQACSSMWLSYNYQNDHLLNPSWFRGNALACHLGAKSCILRKCKRWTVHSALLAHKAQCTSCTVHFLHSARIAQCHCISCTVHILHSTQCKVHILHLLVAPLSST